jgi:hypothetical protein
MKKASKWVGIVLLLLVVLPLVVVIAINAVDETLDPQAAVVGAPRPPAVPDADNGYHALLAMGANDGADGAAYAVAWLAEARTAAKENRAEKHAETKRAKRAVLCDALQASCLSEVRAKGGDIKVQLEAYAEDLQRYEKLIAFKRYEEVLDYPMRVVSTLPSYVPVIGAQKAYLLRAVLAIEEGNLDAALDVLERDLAFQRVMLEGARTLIGKMTAAAAYTRDLALVADLLRQRGGDLAPQVPRLRAMLQPMSAAALRILPALETEFAMSRDVLPDPVANTGDGRQASLGERLVARAFYKPNATINRAYRQYAASAVAASAPAHGIKAAFASAGQSLGEMGVWDYVNNPVGNILLRVGAPGFGEYAYRLHDLDAYNRLVGLWVDMIGAGVGTEGAANFLAASAPRFHDPYTQKPMRWDAEKRRVYFEAQGSFSKRRREGVDNGRVFIEL